LLRLHGGRLLLRRLLLLLRLNGRGGRDSGGGRCSRLYLRNPLLGLQLRRGIVCRVSLRRDRIRVDEPDDVVHDLELASAERETSFLERAGESADCGG
jgi:hypothetical protein